MKKYLIDYHTQTIDHGDNKPLLLKETIEAAIKQRLIAICLTDHFPLPPNFQDSTHDGRVQYPDYYWKAIGTKETFKGKIEVDVGAEFDWFPMYREWISDQINKYEFDYLIGSVHFLGKIKDESGERNFCHDFSYEEFMSGLKYYKDIKTLVCKYYQEVRNMIDSGLFDGVGHIDLIKKFNDGSLFNQNEEWYKDQVFQTLDVLTNSSMVMEINTSGWDKKCKEQYPSLWILEDAYKRGIPITIGSDAHTPEKIGSNLDKAIVLAKQAGYTSLVRFKKRKPIIVEI